MAGPRLSLSGGAGWGFIASHKTLVKFRFIISRINLANIEGKK
jgi:hypothetical protein